MPNQSYLQFQDVSTNISQLTERNKALAVKCKQKLLDILVELEKYSCDCIAGSGKPTTLDQSATLTELPRIKRHYFSGGAVNKAPIGVVPVSSMSDSVELGAINGLNVPSGSMDCDGDCQMLGVARSTGLLSLSDLSAENIAEMIL